MDSALITGATKGIGRAIALAFAKQGLNVAICSRNEQDLLQLKQELEQINPQIRVVAGMADCTVKQQLLGFAAQAEMELGFIKVLVNNVGSYEPRAILDDDADTLILQLHTNLIPAYELYRYFGKTMLAARSGHIFNICSVAAIEPVVNAGSYTVTKAAQLSLTQVMRLETQAYGIKVTAVLPGSTFTASWQASQLDKSKFVQPEDVASAVINCYLMSAGANVDELVIKPVSGQLS